MYGVSEALDLISGLAKHKTVKTHTRTHPCTCTCTRATHTCTQKPEEEYWEAPSALPFFPVQALGVVFLAFGISSCLSRGLLTPRLAASSQVAAAGGVGKRRCIQHKAVLSQHPGCYSV